LTRLKLCTRSCLNSCQTSTHVLQRTDRPESYMMGIISSCDQVYKQSTGAWFGTYRERDIDQIPLWHSTHCCTYCTHKVLTKCLGRFQTYNFYGFLNFLRSCPYWQRKWVDWDVGEYTEALQLLHPSSSFVMTFF
jgi:hypothetical protein